MSDYTLFWKDKNTSSGIVGTYFNADVMGKVSPSVNVNSDQFIQAISGTPRGLVIKGGTYIKIIDADGNHRIYGSNDDITIQYAEQRLDTGTAFQSAKDYYIYLCQDAPGTGETLPTAKIVISLNSTYPNGYTASTSRKIGGFHTLCTNVGTISGHALTGFVAGDILPASIWCLTHRPYPASPEGMAYISALDFWADIYLQSGSGANTKSVFGGTITDTQTLATHFEDLFKVGKTPLSDPEFSAAAEGSNQQTAIAGAADPVTTGGHLDTAGRRMISNYGLEDCCGALWQHLESGGANGGSSWSGTDGGKGCTYGGNTLLAGGAWDNAACCGSRARNAGSARVAANANGGCRGRARSLRLR